MLPPDAQTRARSDRTGPRLHRGRARRRVRDARERSPEDSHLEHARRRPIGAREVLAAAEQRGRLLQEQMANYNTMMKNLKAKSKGKTKINYFGQI